MSAYEQGMSAAARGLTHASNPHAEGSSNWHDWRRGYRDQVTGAFSKASIEANVRLS